MSGELELGVGGPLCPVCGRVARATSSRVERVVFEGRDRGWGRQIVTYHHDDGSEHRVPRRPVFD